MSAKVSVIVPVYKVESYLHRCVDSLLNQTMKDLEIILVDDSSPDGCPRICDEYSMKDARIKVIHKLKNEGLGFARNTGLLYATGEYVTFCDSDDWLDSHAYENIYYRCKKDDLDMCCFQFRRIKIDGSIIEQPIVRHKTFYGIEGSKEFALGLIGKDAGTQGSETYGMSSCMALFRKDLFDRTNIRYPSEREVASEDLVFLLEFVLKMKKIEIVPDVYYNYLINPASISQNFSNEKYKRLIKMLDVVKSYCNSNFKYDEYINHFFTQQLRIFKIILRFISSGKYPLSEKKRWIAKVTNHDYLKSFYESDVRKKYSISDRIYISAMKHKLSFFFILLYKIRK